MVALPGSDIERGSKCGKAGAASLLSLAAAPTFAIMALFTAVNGGSMPDTICSATSDVSPLAGMMPMYLLMSTFHLAPWLRLLTRR